LRESQGVESVLKSGPIADALKKLKQKNDEKK